MKKNLHVTISSKFSSISSFKLHEYVPFINLVEFLILTHISLVFSLINDDVYSAARSFPLCIHFIFGIGYPSVIHEKLTELDSFILIIFPGILSLTLGPSFLKLIIFLKIFRHY
jgi:hypothetical protein